MLLMTLYFIGLGLNNEKDITLKGLEAVKKCDSVYLENYTSVLQCSKEKLEKLLEQNKTIASGLLMLEKYVRERAASPSSSFGRFK